MAAQPILSPEEWTLISHLLEERKKELHTILHHTRTSGAREEIQAQLHQVEELLDRIRIPSHA